MTGFRHWVIWALTPKAFGVDWSLEHGHKLWSDFGLELWSDFGVDTARRLPLGKAASFMKMLQNWRFLQILLPRPDLSRQRRKTNLHYRIEVRQCGSVKLRSSNDEIPSLGHLGIDPESFRG